MISMKSLNLTNATAGWISSLSTLDTAIAVIVAVAGLLLFPQSLLTQDREALKPVRESDASLEFRLPFCGAQGSVTIDLPKKLEVTQARGVDFDLFAISEKGAPTSMTVYIGHAPDVRHPAGAAWRTLTIGTIAARLYSWTEKRQKAKSYERELVIDALFPQRGLQVPIPGPGRDASSTFPPKPPIPGVPVLPPPECQQGTVIHLRASGPDIKAVDRLIDAARTLKAG